MNVFEDFEHGTENYCSMELKNRADSIRLYNASSNPDFKLSDKLGEHIRIKDFIVEKISLVSRESGELKDTPRVILIDDDGKTYVATSFGLLGCLKKMVTLFGAPTWNEPVEVIAEETRSGKGYRVTNLRAV